MTEMTPRHRDILGRDDVIDHIEAVLGDPSIDGWICISGTTGVGKSSVARKLVARREEQHRATVTVWIRRGFGYRDDDDESLRSLCEQIEAIYPQLTSSGSTPSARFAELLEGVGDAALEEPLVIVIDGLNETEHDLQESLPATLPSGVRGVITVDAGTPQERQLRKRASSRFVDLDDVSWLESNQQVCRQLVEERGLAWREDGLYKALVVSCGRPLYFAMLLDWLEAMRSKAASESDPAAASDNIDDYLAVGQESLFARIWRQLEGLEPDDRDALRHACGQLGVARDRIPLAAFRHWLGDAACDLLATLFRPYFAADSWANGDVEIEHESTRRFVRTQVADDQCACEHLRLVDAVDELASLPQACREREWAMGYLARYRVHHLLSGKHLADAAALLRQLPHWVAHAEAECLQIALLDWRRFDETRMRIDGEASTIGRALDRVAEIVRAGRVFLSSHPEALPSFVYSRLVRDGWSQQRIEEAVGFGPALPRIRLEHPVRIFERPATPATGDPHAAKTAAVMFSRGDHLVTATVEGSIQVWNLNTGRVALTLAGHGWPATSCAIDPAATMLATSSWDEQLRVWDLQTGSCLQTLRGHARGITSCALDAIRGRVISASWDETVRIWDIESGGCLHTMRRHQSEVTSCALSSDGLIAATGSADHTVRVWHTTTGREIGVLSEHRSTVNHCTFSPNGEFIVSASSDHDVRIWSVRNGDCTGVLEGHTCTVLSAAVSSDNTRVYAGARDGSIREWDIESGDCLRVFEQDGAVTHCEIARGGATLVTVSQETGVLFWDLDTGESRCPLYGRACRVTSSPLVSAAAQCLSTLSDGSVQAWDTERGTCEQIIDAPSTPITASCRSSSNRLLTARLSRRLQVWDLDAEWPLSNSPLCELEGHEKRIVDCELLADGALAVSASIDGTVRLWDIESASCRHVLTGHSDEVSRAIVTSDEKRVISASWDRTARVWNLESGECEVVLEGHEDGVSDVVSIPHSSDVITASWDASLRRWDVESGECRTRYDGHERAVEWCRVTPDGRRLVSASRDGSVRAWDVDSGDPIATIDIEADIKHVTLAPDATEVAVICWDRTLRVFELATGRALSVIHNPADFSTIASTDTMFTAGDLDGNLWMFDRGAVEESESVADDFCEMATAD